MDQKILAFWLANQAGIGRKKIQILLDYFGSLEEIFYCKEHTLQHVPGISDREQKVLQQGRDYVFWQEKLCSLQQRGIRFIWRKDPEYPVRLHRIPDPPFALYVRGEIPDDDKPAVAIVGSRNASHEGLEIARKFGRELAENGIRIISGLARGIDVTAQRGALEIPAGRTYGILGTGIDICYPRNHIETYMQIIHQGGLLSEYAPGDAGKSWNVCGA